MAIDESSAAFLTRPNPDHAQQTQYLDYTLKRFTNAAVTDPVVRVVREPKRKLADNDRLVKPASLALEVGVTPSHLATAIAAALLYDNADDPQAVEITNALNEGGLDSVLASVCNITAGSELAELIKEKIPQVKKLGGK